MSRTFFPPRARKGSKATHEKHLLHTWQYPCNVWAMCQIQETAEMSPWTISVKSIRLWGKATPGFLSTQTRGFTRHWRLKCITRLLYVYALYVHVCLPHQAEYVYVWMDVQVLVCMFLHVCVCHVHVYEYVYACLCSMYMYMCAPRYECLSSCVHFCEYVCFLRYIQVHLYKCVHMCGRDMRTYMYSYMCVHLHVHYA